MKPLLKVFVLLLGTIIILISLLHVFLGPAAIPGSVPVNATMDSEDRFYAVFFLAYGMALIWCGIDLGSRSKHLQLLMIIFFAGGLARLISMAVAGRARFKKWI